MLADVEGVGALALGLGAPAGADAGAVLYWLLVTPTIFPLMRLRMSSYVPPWSYQNDGLCQSGKGEATHHAPFAVVRGSSERLALRR